MAPMSCYEAFPYEPACHAKHDGVEKPTLLGTKTMLYNFD